MKMNLPMFIKKPIRVGDSYPIISPGNRNFEYQVVTISEEVPGQIGYLPKWVRFIVNYEDGFEDFMDRDGLGFVNIWGIRIARTKFDLLKHRINMWMLRQRYNLSNLIYPHND